MRLPPMARASHRLVAEVMNVIAIPPTTTRAAIWPQLRARAAIAIITIPDTALVIRRLGPGPIRSAIRPAVGAATAAPTANMASSAPSACSSKSRSSLSRIARVLIRKAGVVQAT